MKSWILIIYSVFFILTNSNCLLGNQAASYEFVTNITELSRNLQNTPFDDYMTLSELHSSRGEDYLFLGMDQKAFEDFMIAYQYGVLCGEEDKRTVATFRSLFGLFLVYARAEDLEAVQNLGQQLQQILDFYSCDDCQDHSDTINQINTTSIITQGRPKSTKLGSYGPSKKERKKGEDYPIQGPNQIPVKECLERVTAVGDLADILIQLVQKKEIRIIAKLLIDSMVNSANNCCRSGGLWKACLQTLVNKWKDWQMFGVPPDPAWD